MIVTLSAVFVTLVSLQALLVVKLADRLTDAANSTRTDTRGYALSDAHIRTA